MVRRNMVRRNAGTGRSGTLTFRAPPASLCTYVKMRTRRLQIMNSHSLSRLTISIAAIVLGFSSAVLAGPPLVCHPIAIDNAKTLPWVDLNYQKGQGRYDLTKLTPDTLAILDSNP